MKCNVNPPIKAKYISSFPQNKRRIPKHSLTLFLHTHDPGQHLSVGGPVTCITKPETVWEKETRQNEEPDDNCPPRVGGNDGRHYSSENQHLAEGKKKIS